MTMGRLAALAALLFAVAAPTALAGTGDFKLEVTDKEPPEELADDIRALIAPKVYTISDADGVLYQFWFVKELVLSKKPSKYRDLLTGIEPIGLLGAAVIAGDERCIDFRDDVIDPGTVTMRMGEQPQDGNHMGTAPADTFAILMPADRDEGLNTIPDHDTLVEMSLEGTVAEHPPIFFMQPDAEDATEHPRLSVGGEHGRIWHLLCLKIPAKIAGEDGEVAFQMVFDGIGDL